MKTFGDLRKILEENPTTWTLMDDVDDNEPLPQFPVTDQDARLERGEPTSREKLRALLLEYLPNDPLVLYMAVQNGLIERTEAENIIHTTWGNDFSLDDFTPPPSEDNQS